jgi:hypothetical protein
MRQNQQLRLGMADALIQEVVRQPQAPVFYTVSKNVDQLRKLPRNDRAAEELHSQVGLWLLPAEDRIELILNQARARAIELGIKQHEFWHFLGLLIAAGEPLSPLQLRTLGVWEDGTTDQILALTADIFKPGVPYVFDHPGCVRQIATMNQECLLFDPKECHGRLADGCIREWSATGSAVRDYALRNTIRHLVEASDYTRLVPLVRSPRPGDKFACGPFLEEKAGAMGAAAALTDARAAAEALVAVRKEHWDDLVDCAYAHCTLAERVRGAPQALEALAQRGEVELIERAIESESDAFRRGSLLLASATLLREAGHVTAAGDLWKRGAGLVTTELQTTNRSQSSEFSYEMNCVVNALLSTGDRDGSTNSGRGNVRARRTTSKADVRPAGSGRRVPWYYVALLYIARLGPGKLMVGWLLTGNALIFIHRPMFGPGPAGELPQALGRLESVGAIFGLGAIPIGIALIFFQRWLSERSAAGIQSAMEQLVASCARKHGTERRSTVLRILRWYDEMDASWWFAECIPPPLLWRLALLEFRRGTSAEEAALLLSAAVSGGDSAEAAFLAELRRMPLPRLASLYQEAARTAARRRHHAPAVRLALGMSALLGDPDLLLDLLRSFERKDALFGELEFEIRPRIELARHLRADERFKRDVGLVSAAASPGFLARAVIAASLRRRAFEDERRYLPSVHHAVSSASRALQVFRFPLCRTEPVLFFLLSVLPAVGYLGLLPFLLLFGLVRAACLIVLPFMVPVRAPHQLRVALRAKDDVQLRRDLTAHLLADLKGRVTPRQTRVLFDTVLAQSILRHDRADYDKIPARSVERAVATLVTQGLVDLTNRDSFRNIISNRILLDMVARLGESISQSSRGSAVGLATDREVLTRAMPFASRLRSFGLLMSVFVALMCCSCAWLVWMRPSNGNNELILLTVIGSLSGGVWLALIQIEYPRVAAREDPDLELFTGPFFQVGLALSGLVLSSEVFGPLLVYEAIPWLGGALKSVKGLSDDFIWEQIEPVADVALWMRHLWPFVFVLLAPVLIDRWRGAGLLCPTRWQLWRQRLVWLLLAVGATVGLAGAAGALHRLVQ